MCIRDRVTVEVAQLKFVEVEEVGQCGTCRRVGQVPHQGAPAPLPDRRLDVLEDDLAALAVELDRAAGGKEGEAVLDLCLLYTSPSPRDGLLSRMPSSA